MHNLDKNTITRRMMIKQSSLASLAILLEGSVAGINEILLMNTKRIPSTGEELPVIGLGTWQQFDVGESDSDRASLREVLKLLHERGGSVIDSSPMYGRAESVVGDITSDIKLQDEFFYATKVWTNGEQNGIRQMEESFRKMRRTKMDLMQIHNLVDWRTHLKTLREWKEQGKIRYIGLTHYTDSSHEQLERIIRNDAIDFLQVNYSIISRNAEKSLFPACLEKKVAVIANQPFESGSLFRSISGKSLPTWTKDLGIASWGQFFLKFILAHPAITCVIPGTSNPKHLMDNASAGTGALPDAATRTRMAQHIASL